MLTRTITTKLAVGGEKEFKAQMTSVNNELRTLKSEMKLADAEFKGQVNTLDALTAKDKILREEYAQQTEKVKALERAVAEASGAYGEADTRTDKYRQQLNNAKTDLINLNREIEENSRYMDEAAQSSDGCAKSIDGFGKEVTEAEKNVSTFGEVLKANLASEAIISGLERLSGAIVKVGTDAIRGTLNTAAYADEILTLSTNTGLSTETLQEFIYMAELTDTSLDTITGSMSKLIRNMSAAREGSGNAADAFRALDIEITNADGSLRSNKDVFYEVIDALGKMDNETQRDAYSMAIFGKSAQDLNSFIAQGADGIAAFAKEAHDMGAVLDEETLQSLGEVDDAYQRFRQTLDAVKNKAAVELQPVLREAIAMGDEAVRLLGELIAGNISFQEFLDGLLHINEATEAFGKFLPLATGVVTAMVAYKTAASISSVIDALRAATESQTIAQAALNAVMNANPLVLIVTLIAGVTTALVVLWNTNEEFREKVTTAWEGLETAANDVFNDIVGWFRSVGQAIAEAKQWGSDLIDNFVGGVKEKWSEFTSTISGLAQTVKDFLGFSEPEKGPLSNFHTFPLDMMDLYISGMASKRAALADEVEDIAQLISDGISNPLGDDSSLRVSAMRTMAELSVASAGFGNQGVTRADLSTLMAGAVNGLGTQIDGLARNITVHAVLQLPDGTQLAEYYLPSFIDVGAANGTPIATPVKV